MTQKYKVPNLENGISILELLANNPKGLTLLQTLQQVDVSQTSAYRILNTLVYLGYLDYNETSKVYKSTRRMLTMGFKSLDEHGLLEIALIKMRKLRDVVKETVFLGVLKEDKGIFIEQAEGLHPFKFLLSPGHEVELHSSALGKAALAFMPENLQDYYLDLIKYTKFTPNTITSKEKMTVELKKIHKLGYAIDNEEQLLGVMCVGAPIFDYRNLPIAAIWISGPIGRFDKKVIKDIVPYLLETTTAISEQMGFVKTKKLNH